MSKTKLDETGAIKCGVTVYARNGLKAEYVQKLEHGHLVRPLFTITAGGGDDIWEEDASSSFDIWPDALLDPPVAELHEEVARVSEELAQAHRKLNETRAEIRAAERENEGRIKALARFEPLKNLADLLSGAITHFVVPGAASVSISTFNAKAAYGGPEDRYDREKKYRVMSLDLRPNGSLGWSLSGYADGSGEVSSDIYPCTSIEDAQQVGYNYIVGRLGRLEYEKYPHLWIEAVKGITDLGFPVPEDISALADRAIMAREEKNIASATANLKTAKDALDGAKGRLAEVTKKGA